MPSLRQKLEEQSTIVSSPLLVFAPHISLIVCKLIKERGKMTTLANTQETSSMDLEMCSMKAKATPFLPQEKVMLMEGAAAATNLGVVCSSKGELSYAMELFREALVTVKMAFTDDLKPEDIPRDSLVKASHRIAQAQTSPSTYSRSDADSFLVPKMDITFPRGYDVPSTKVAAMEDCPSDSLFSHLLSIQPPATFESNPRAPYYFCTDSEVDSSLFSAVIIYNMAVTTHNMVPLQPPGRRKEGFRKRARSLYDMCNQLLANAAEQVEGDTTTTSSNSAAFHVRKIGRAVYDLMAMAIINNQACLLLDTVDRQLFIFQMDRLVDIAASVRSRRYGNETYNATIQTAVDFFLSNATKSRLCTASAAAAA